MRPFSEVFVVELTDQDEYLFADGFQFPCVPYQFRQEPVCGAFAESPVNGMHNLIVVIRNGPELIKKIVQTAVKLDGGPVDLNHFQFLAE